ncbi:uncharacterized protein [Drosophila kikkawai]|uniref:Pro-Pol polyprotein n=1 Tax=Drosophila kikkawai TaxID=30033 RepID=A0ABM4GHX7_DROKI
MPRLNVPHFYIPHHYVLKPTSTSTKLRVVFDASCQTTSQKSLNDLLMVGPTIQPDLYTLLLRFRTYRYVITVDGVKMFRQVLVDAEDRKFQYILWRSNPVEPVRTFELNTVTYGTATAPYLAIRSMIYLADQYSNKFKAKHFSEDIGLLQKGKLTRTNLRNLNPFLQVTDGFELLKVGGRLELVNVPDTQRHPILLPSKDFFMHQYVQHIHLKNFHAGPKALVALIRLRFWIVNARDLARRVVRCCVHCVRYRPTLEKQVMGQLPVERLTQSRPFSRCGVDFCGPINIYAHIRGKAPSKGYIAVFICFATKAVHVEVVAPHFGGLWEAAVKSVKGLLNRTLANTRLTFEELTTVTAEVEAILNSRPLSPLSTDPNGLAALTPGHFLVGDFLRSLPEPSVEDSKVDHLERWQRVSAIKQYLWRRWSHEYINELQMRTNWTQPSPNLSVGDMVLIHEDNLPPQRWLLGRIEAAIPGKDQRVRVADVRTAKGVYRRPIHKLALLPVS